MNIKLCVVHLATQQIQYTQFTLVRNDHDAYRFQITSEEIKTFAGMTPEIKFEKHGKCFCVGTPQVNGQTLIYDIPDCVLAESALITSEISLYQNGARRTLSKFVFSIRADINTDNIIETKQNQPILSEIQQKLDKVRRTVFDYTNRFEFPNVGTTGFLYIDKSEGASYYWDEERAHYFIAGTDYNNITVITGGNANG